MVFPNLFGSARSEPALGLSGSAAGPGHRLQLEPLEQRCLLSAFDFADLVIDEVEPNDTDDQAQQISFDISNDILAVGVDGGLSTVADADKYRFAVDAGGHIQLKFEIPEGQGQDITALAAGPDSQAYFIAGNALWREQTTDDDVVAEILVTRAQLALAAGVATDALEIADIAVTPGGSVVCLVADSGQVLQASPDGDGFETSVVITESRTLQVTGDNDARLVAVAIDAVGTLYLADQASGQLLQATTADGDSYTLSLLAEADTISEALQLDVLIDLDRGLTSMPRTVLASTEGDFVANALVRGRGNYGPAPGAADIYYVSQLGPEFGGTGGVQKISIDENDPTAAVFEDFFTPTAEQQDINPSALALDTNGAFGGHLFMGSFGASLGDDQDGALYTLDAAGNLEPFTITSFVDENGDPVRFDDEDVTGFFDVTDMAFSYGGPFGTYLYVLSENVDSNGAADGGFSSDLWRVSPDGVAELFVPDVADGAITLAFDNTFQYGNDLFVATFTDGGRVLRVSSDGAVEAFFDFGQFDPNLRVSDLVFTPYLDDVESPLEGSLAVTLKTNGPTFVVQLLPDGNSFQTWAGNLQTGDVSAGDMAFDADGGLVVLQAGETRALTRLDYQGLFEITFDDVQVRTETVEVPVEGGEEGEVEEQTVYVPYVSLSIADQPRIVRFGGEQTAADIMTAVSPVVTNGGETPEDNSKPISFTFDDAGDLYLFVQNSGTLWQAAGDESGAFLQPSSVLTTETIGEEIDLVDPQIRHLAWSSDGRLLARGGNGLDVDEGDPVPDQLLDDVVLVLGDTEANNFEAEVLAPVTDLTRMRVTLAGPNFSRQFTVPAGELRSEFIEDIDPGNYIMTVNSLIGSQGAYQAVVSTLGDLVETHTVRTGDPPLAFTTVDGDRLELALDGPGRVELVVDQKPSGTVIALQSLTVAGGSARTEVSLRNLDDATAIDLETINLDAPVGVLRYRGSVDTVTQSRARALTVREAVLGDVADIDAERVWINDLVVRNLGAAGVTAHTFDVRGINNLEVEQDLTNISLLDARSRNTYQDVMVGGRIEDVTLYGRQIKSLTVRNDAAAESAIEASVFDLVIRGGDLRTANVVQGDIVDSTFRVNRTINEFALSAGDLVDSSIEVGRTLRWGYVGGDVDVDSVISVAGLRSSTIDRLLVNGDYHGTLEAVRLNYLMVGYDRDGQRRSEPSDGSFAGSDLTGTVTAFYNIREINVTGTIDEAVITSSLGSINNVFVEDGLNEVTLRARRRIDSVLVGYEDGRRREVVNNSADVSGTISAFKLGRLYYTGTLATNTSLPAVSGPVRDDVPGT